MRLVKLQPRGEVGLVKIAKRGKRVLVQIRIKSQVSMITSNQCRSKTIHSHSTPKCRRNSTKIEKEEIK